MGKIVTDREARVKKFTAPTRKKNFIHRGTVVVFLHSLRPTVQRLRVRGPPVEEWVGAHRCTSAGTGVDGHRRELPCNGHGDTVIPCVLVRFFGGYTLDFHFFPRVFFVGSLSLSLARPCLSPLPPKKYIKIRVHNIRYLPIL